jgi:hypothetical protein
MPGEMMNPGTTSPHPAFRKYIYQNAHHSENIFTKMYNFDMKILRYGSKWLN